MRILFISIFVGMVSLSYSQDSTKQKVAPAKQGLNGHYTLRNKRQQVTKDGTFEDNRLKDGKYYVYDEKGKLLRIELYKDFNYVGNDSEK